MKKKILITGANGMIGSGLVRQLVDKYELILVQPNINRIKEYKNKANIIKKSLIEISEWEQALDDVYCVVHLAAAVHWKPKTSEDEESFIKTNFDGTEKLYEACERHNVERFLFFSTNDVYKDSNDKITEETELSPIGIYAKSKFLAEKYLLEKAIKNKTSVCIFRPASVYGENDRGSMKSLINFCKKGVVPMIGKGDNKKSLLYLKDIVEAVEIYIESKDNFNREIFNISSGEFEYKEIIDSICEIFNYKPMRIYIPKWFCINIASKLSPLKKLSTAAETKVVLNIKANEILKYKGKFDLNNGLHDSKHFYDKVL